jgi:transcription initiation factor TFIIB
MNIDEKLVQQLRLTCPDGPKHVIIEDEERGEVVCNRCGIVLQDNVAVISPWDGESDTTQYMQNLGKSTVLGQFTKRNPGTSQDHMRAIGLRIQQRNIVHRAEKRRIDEYNITSTICTKLGLPLYIQKDVERMFELISKKRLGMGRDKRLLAAAAILYYCRKYGIPKTAKDIAKAEVATKGQQLNINLIIKFKKMLEKNFGYVTNATTIESYVPQIASKLGIEKYEKRIYELLAKAKKQELHVGMNPVVLICTIIYRLGLEEDETCALRVTQNRLSDECSISSVALRNTLTKLEGIIVS